MPRSYLPTLRKPRLTIFSLTVVLALILQSACFTTTTASIPEESRGVAMQDIAVVAPPAAAQAGTTGLHITLGEGAEQPTAAQTLPVAPAQPLTSADLQQLLSRLSPLVAPETDVQGFKLPPASLPPPRPGATITQTFPPTGTASVAPVVESGPLQVLRFAPEGELRVAPFLNITFNQPMVPLATLDDLKAQDVPVKLTPEVPGVWKWLGTRTLSFEYKSDELDIDRFPKATTYTVEIPAGTKSATGGELAEAVTWTFTTPPPRLGYTYPSTSPQPVNPLLFVSFDQNIDAAAVLETISVTAGGQTYPVRPATQAELDASQPVQNLIKSSREGRWLAFRAEQDFPADTTVVVNIGPGTPSAEGPLTTTEVQSYSFTTYAPLRIVEAICAYGGSECPPLSPFSIRFNNPINEEKFDPALITADPAIPNMTVTVFGDSLQIQGGTQGRTTYKITVDGKLEDIFGQTLGQNQTVTIKTGSAARFLSGPSSNFVTLDPSASKPLFNIYTTNYEQVRVRAFAVTPQDWPAYLRWFNENAYQESPIDPPGQEVINQKVTINAAPDTLVETGIDLTEALNGPTGHVVVFIDSPPGLLGSLLGNADRNRVIAWVQVTQIGLDALVDRGQLIAWATNLQTGAPLADVELQLVGGDLARQTDATGVAQFELPGAASQLLIAKLGDDTAILPANSYYWDVNSGWVRQPIVDEVRWYIFDDRQMYRPGEEVHLKGWLRRVEGQANGDVTLVGSGLEAVQYQVSDPQGNQIGNGVAEVNNLGGFDFAFTLPANANLGNAQIYLSARNVGDASGADAYHNIQIQEFRRPEFEVAARNEEQGPFFVGGQTVVSVNAKYFAGGPLPNAATNWNVTVAPGSYAPPNWPDFTFGKWTPWWFDYGYSGDFGGGSSSIGYQGKTDPSGTHYLRMNFDSIDEPRPYSILADASVMDVNRQTWAATTSLLVHPADLYVGIRSDRYFVQQGEPLVIEAIVTDLDGKAVAETEITIKAARLEWKYVKQQWREEEADVQECTVSSVNEPVKCTFTTDQGGSYRITATIKDGQGRSNLSQFTRWVSGGQSRPERNVQQEQVTLIPNQERYQPGDTAEILVQSPFGGPLGAAEGLATIQRGDIITTTRFQITDGTYTLKVPILDEHIPNLTVQVDLTGSAPRTDDQGKPVEGAAPRPAFATGRIDLPIPPLSRTLKLGVTPAVTATEPSATTTVSVTVNDANGAPVADAELAVVVVDEAILALTNYQLADPVAAFYAQRYSTVSGYYGRSSIVLANPQQLAEGLANAAQESAYRSVGVGGAAPAATADLAMPMAAAAPAAESKAMEQSQAAPIAIRSNFNPLATFAPAVRTDDQGQAVVEVKLPDNLTRYRVIVVAVADGKFFGMGESSITARLPLMVRPAAPRFLNFGDHFELPVVVQNQTDVSMTVAVGVQVSNLRVISGTVDSRTVTTDLLSTGKLITVPANDRVEVRFPATTVNAGTARAQIAVTAGDFADAAAIELPVYTPATTEAFAVYGVVDEGAVAQPLLTPTDVYTQFGGLEINTSSTALQALTDAVLYLVAYPYECSEQLASRILAVAALRDVLSAFNAAGLPAPAEMESAVQRDIARLQGMQNDDGGFPIWERGRDSVPYYSIHVAHALQRAKLKGFAVPADMQQRVLDHLRNIESYYPAWYGEATRHALSAYALYVRKLMSDVDTAKARDLLNSKPLEDQSLEAVGWLWQVLSGDAASATEVEAIRQLVNNRAVETAGAANFTTSYGDQAYLLLHSNRRTDGILLDALINDQPESDLIPKVVNGLLAHRKAGRWENTQENAFILLALDRYFNTFEAQTPDFVARVWLGDTYAAEHTYQGRTTERQETVVPMSYLTQEAGVETRDLVISKDGAGRLYYRLGLRYAPTDLNLKPLEMGFVVQRTYEAVDAPEDVTRDADGVWHFKAGARVRVRLTMVADNRRYHVALVDPLPAGLEIINPALAVAESVPQDPNDRSSYGWWWGGSWFEHQNLRDSRAEAFTTLLWDGVYNYSYVARATTPGTFVVPPAKAEEMYSPEVFGRSASDQVVVE